MLPYAKTVWDDHLVDPVTEEVIQQGTRFTAKRANNLEDMVEYLANTHVPYVDNELMRIQLELEMLGRSPVNNGTIFDPFDGEEGKQMTMLKQRATLQNARNAGATTLTVDVVPFIVGESITLVDEEQTENVTITAINNQTLTITATTKAFKKGAFVTRTNAVLDTSKGNLQFGKWSTFKVEVV